MTRLPLVPLIALVLAAAAAPRALAEDPPAGGAPPRGETATAASPQSIQWFGTWTAGAAEAKRTGRPILLLAAAPQCHGISGLW